jgi:hypothetical protein
MVCRRKSKTLFVDSAVLPLTSGVGAHAIEVTYQTMIQGSKPEPRIMRYELSDHDWSAIKPMLPNKVRGVPRVNDRRVLNGIFWVLRVAELSRTRLTGDLRPCRISTRTSQRRQVCSAQRARGFAGWRHGLAPDCGWVAQGPSVQPPSRGG